ncbi:uncharacterized protein [Epargyreus clarus]|uniref:uncharacterized protein n=1 Tax=Epargyreus clarus TaxID=520877 RepID=UPI003C2EA0FB
MLVLHLPNCSLAAYEAFLGRVGDCIRGCLPRPVFVLGDFNAHSRAWGSKRDNARGNAVLEWAAELDLRLLNRGSVSTCVRWQGESIVDLSWATASAKRLVTGWRVAEAIVTLSDHRHITLDVALQLPVHNGRLGEGPPRRWALKRLDRDMLIAAAHVVDWSGTAAEGATPDFEQRAVRLRADMAAICDAAMPRVRSGRRGPAYWWSDYIAQLRAACLRSRRKYTRARRRRTAGAEETEERYREYRNATVALQIAISDSKSRSWSGLQDGLDRDPWGRPYRMVLGKLRPWVPPLTETMDPDFVTVVMGNLFPFTPDSPDAATEPSVLPEWTEELTVSETELG